MQYEKDSIGQYKRKKEDEHFLSMTTLEQNTRVSSTRRTACTKCLFRNIPTSRTLQKRITSENGRKKWTRPKHV